MVSLKSIGFLIFGPVPLFIYFLNLYPAPISDVDYPGQLQRIWYKTKKKRMCDQRYQKSQNDLEVPMECICPSASLKRSSCSTTSVISKCSALRYLFFFEFMFIGYCLPQVTGIIHLYIAGTCRFFWSWKRTWCRHSFQTHSLLFEEAKLPPQIKI